MTSLDYDRLVALLNELGDELRSVGASGAIYVVGGSAMALAGYTENRVTHDVDALITDGHGQVVDVVRKVGRRHGLPGSWLNEQVTPYLSRNPDTEATLVFEHPNLVVTAASPSRLLAMKLTSGRLWTRQRANLRSLDEAIGGLFGPPGCDHLFWPHLIGL